MELVPGVHRIGKLRGGNVYLLADARLTLVDTGLPGGAARVLSFIRNLGRDPGELDYIIITHGHIDHAGGAAELRRLTGARVAAHRDEGVRTEDGTLVLRGDLNRPSGPLVQAMSRFGRFEPCPIDVAVSDGGLLPCAGGMRVVHTPGHTRGSISLMLEESGILFVGDAIVSNRDRLSRPLPFGADRAESECSLARLAQLAFNVCCFGHGPAVTSNASEAVAALAASPPKTPLWQRIVFRRGDLARFGVRMFKE